MLEGSISSISYGGQIDANALKTNQIAIVAVIVIAFILGSDVGPWLILALAISLTIGAARPGYGPIQLFYRHALLASRRVRVNTQPSPLAPYRFAQAMGAGVLMVAVILLLAGATWLGWVLAWLVAALALVNLLFGFCAGCFVYLQIRRLGSVA